jgi:hypothetical protein
MVDVKEQHICIKICFKLSKTGIETHMLTLTFRKGIIGRAQPFYWSSKPKSGVTSRNNGNHSGKPPRTKWKKMCESRLFTKTNITL